MGSVKITEKPISPSVKNADTIMTVIDGKLYRAELGTIAELLSASQVAAIEQAGDEATEKIAVKISTAEREVSVMVENANGTVTEIVNEAKGEIDTTANEAKEKLNASATAANAEFEAAVKRAQDAATRAETAADSAAQEVKTGLEILAQDAQNAKTAAEQSAQSAKASADRAEELADSVDADKVQAQLDAKADNLYYDESTNLLYLTCGGEIISDGIKVSASGGGGGGGGASYAITLKNLLDTRTFTVPDGADIILKFSYSSVDEEWYEDGDGVGTVFVNGTRKATVGVKQGENTLNVKDYVSSGTSTVKITVENSEGSSRSLAYTVTLISLSMSTTLDAMATYSGDVVFYYTPVGSGEKTIHFLMDGAEIGSTVVTSTGKSQSYTIPEQTAGGHTFTAYAEITVDETVVQSNTITLGMLWVSDTMTDPAILSTFTQTSAVQGDVITIPHMVYDPQNETTSVTYDVLDKDDATYSSKVLSVDRTVQSWVVQDYPAGDITLKITCGAVSKSFAVSVSESTVSIDPVTDSLALLFDPTGRSNLEDDPATWTDGTVAATFNNVGFTGADGWLTDADGASLLRILPGGEVTIPFKIFESDARTAGMTVEVEMATHNVRDYDTVVMSCLSGGRGFKIASQYAQIRSEQSEVSMQFKEDEKVRVSFVVEPRNLHRLIYVYVDGVMCGATQYPTDDNFAQSPAAGITIGAESSGIDLYRIRAYAKGLTRLEILDNYIADRPTLAERVDAAKRNDIFDVAEDIVIDQLPAATAHMIIECEELPQYKGHKKTCQISFTNRADQARSFVAQDAEIDVQGTSSAGYKVKNFKIKLKNGVTYTMTMEKSDTYKLRTNSIPATVYCMKADVASSEGANNVELVRLYNDIVPYKTAPQEANSQVRVGIDGLPCVVFWQNPTTNETRFIGKYNFNFDKSASDVFGLTDGCESWEVRNNTSDRVVFKSADFSGTEWQDDFEARYPDGNTDCTKLQALCEWIVSTDRSAVSDSADKEARLQKFKDEFEGHFVKTPMLFYYLFTEVFLMVDSRAKNFFLTTYDGVHWLPLPYDFDTALGINNEGQLVFDYDLEDTDTVDGDIVFNGQDSVLWCNIRDAFGDEIKEMYNTLRSKTGTEFSSEKVETRFDEHQAVWPEAVWNEDSWTKYLEPLENDNNASYLTMLQGDKSSQRAWWLFNGFRYRDSKYQCGDAETNFVTIRCYAVGDITVTPYSHIWPRIKYGSYTVTKRGKRNQEVTLECPLSSMSDTEVYIYSADRLASIGDLSALQVGYADFTAATKLQKLKLGDGAGSYQNTRLNKLFVGNNELLTTLDVRNCASLSMTVDLSGCVGIESILAKGSAVTGFTLPVGGRLKTLEIPATVTNLTLRDLAQFTTLDAAGYEALTTLRVENTPNVPLREIVNGASELSRVRVLGAALDFADATELRRLAAAGGLDANGNNTDTAVLTGTCHVGTISSDELAKFQALWPNLTITADKVKDVFTVTFQNWDGKVLHQTTVVGGQNAADPVENGTISTPTRPSDANYAYTYKGWDKSLYNITENRVITAQYSTEAAVTVTFANWDGSTLYTLYLRSGGTVPDPVAMGWMDTPSRTPETDYGYIFKGWDKALYVTVTENTTYTAQYSTDQKFTFTFYDWDGTTVLDTQSVLNGESAVDPVTAGRIPTPTREQTAQYTYKWNGWSDVLSNVTADRSVTAAYSETVRTYTVTFYNGTTAVQAVKNVAYGGSASYTGGDLTKLDVSNPENYLHTGWSPKPTKITGDTDCYAVYLEVPAGMDEAYGVLWAYENSSPALTRLGAAKSFADPAPATSLTGSGSSPFDSIMPWAGMKKYNIVDGEVKYSEDDEGFSMTDYDTVVYIPEFWYKAQKDTNAKTWIWVISPTQKDGFAKHPGSGRYIGRYHSSGSSAGVYSKSGVAPLVNTSRTNFRTYSHNKGGNWWMLDIATWSALQMLFLIEFANFDSQSKLGQGYGSSSQTCGKSDGAAYHTINGGSTYNQYRWVEQPFGRVLDWVDGFVASNCKCFLGTNNSAFGDTTTGLTNANVTLPSSNWITGFGYSEQFPWAFLPDTASGGSASTFAPDFVSSSSGTVALRVGGDYGSNDGYGLWCFSAYYVAAFTNNSVGSRLLYIP